MVPFQFPGFYGYSRLYTHIRRLGARNHRLARTYDACLSRSGLPHEMTFSSSITLPEKFDFVFLYGWIVFHSMCVPHFHYPLLAEGCLDCFMVWIKMAPKGSYIWITGSHLVELFWKITSVTLLEDGLWDFKCPWQVQYLSFSLSLSLSNWRSEYNLLATLTA